MCCYYCWFFSAQTFQSHQSRRALLATVLVTHDRFCRRRGWGQEPFLHPDQQLNCKLNYRSAANLHISWHRTYSLHHRPQGTTEEPNRTSQSKGINCATVPCSLEGVKAGLLASFFPLPFYRESVCLCVCVKLAYSDHVNDYLRISV